jgi:decaprenylphospho-beta-D-erythro-pentofuranosid-2-ulose 2-reductase
MPPEPPIRVLIVGATSAIATETARIYAAYGARLFLVARNADRLEAVAADLRTRGAAEVNTALLDATDHPRCEEVVDAAWTVLGGLDVALLAHGVLPDQARCQASASETLRAIDVNFGSAVALLTPLANRFEAAGR